MPVPGSASTSAERPALPVFLSPPVLEEATLRAILSWGSALLHGLGSRHPPPASLPVATSLGVLRPYSALGEGSPRPALRRAPRSCRGIRTRVPPRVLRCRSQVFSTSQRLLPPSAVPPFSGGWRSWGSSLQGLIPPTQPRRLVAAGMPSWRFSRQSAFPVLGGGPPGAPASGPRTDGWFHCRLQGFHPLGSRSGAIRSRLES